MSERAEPGEASRLQPELLAEHYFRHQSGQLVATLTRLLGPQSWDLVEDVVQVAFLQALRIWPRRGVPQDPGGWLFQVARNAAIDQLRRARLGEQSRRTARQEESLPDQQLELIEAGEIVEDDQLRLLAHCCHPELPPKSQIALALKLLAGFSVAEIARGLLVTEENIQKSLTRAKQRLREEQLPELTPSELVRRIPLILNVIYLLFNEGYLSCHSDRVIREDLCEEALRLGLLLANHPRCESSAASALVSLMLFHSSRFAARESGSGEFVLLEEQDRTKWDQNRIGAGLRWLWSSGRGLELSSYHLEAGIAAEHCLAATFQRTNWPRILELYTQLVNLRPTAVNRLNRAIAVACVHGPHAGLAALGQIDPQELPADYSYFNVAYAKLYRLVGDLEAARQHFQKALDRSTSRPEQSWLQTQLQQFD